MKRFDDAWLNARRQRVIHREFSAFLNPDSVNKWSAMVDAWNADPDANPDPFQEVQDGKSTLTTFIMGRASA